MVTIVSFEKTYDQLKFIGGDIHFPSQFITRYVCHHWFPRPDPHSPASRNYCFFRNVCSVLRYFESETGGRTNTCENNEHYWTGLCVGRMDQFRWCLSLTLFIAKWSGKWILLMVGTAGNKVCRSESELCDAPNCQKQNTIKNKTGVINDPLGQTHSHASSEHCFLLSCFSRFEKWGWTYGRTTCAKTMIPTGRDWVGRVDQ